jgi:perosamine synthetase
VILQQNAIPVFVDIDNDTFCINTKDLISKITRKTRAIIVVHLFGHPVEMGDILRIAKKYNLRIIEDCTQAHGSRYKNKFVGTLGDIGCFSFYQTKNMTCGEGGMIITNNRKIFDVCSKVVDHGIIKGDLQSYDYDMLGYNYHMTEIQAGIGIEQLKKLNDFNSVRIKNANLYKKLLCDTNLVFQKECDNMISVYHCLTALLPQNLSRYRDWFIEAVRKENVEINRLYPVPLHKTKLFYKYDSNKCVNAENVCKRLFNLYTNPGISAKYITKTCLAIKKVLNYLEYKYGKN